MTLLSLAVVSTLLAQVPPASGARYERPIVVTAPGPQRVAVDATLLAGGAPFTVVRRSATHEVAEGGLSDLRLSGPDGREVPYLLAYRAATEPHWLRAAVQPIAPTDKTSGFEADLGLIQEIDGFDLRDHQRPLMKRFSLEASADREHWTQVISEGTLFDLPDRRLAQTDAGFVAGSYRYLRVTWDDTNSARVALPFTVFVRVAAADAPPLPATVPLGFERRPSEPGRSRYHVTLPGSRLPLVALRLDAGGTYLFRSVTVTEPRLAAWQAAPVTIGDGLLVRDRAGSSLRLAIQQPSQAELDLLVEDGDNPPLELRGVAGEFAELPWIYVEAPGPLVARYGDVTLPRPSYDLEAVRATLKIETLPEARWGTATATAPPATSAPRVDAASLTGAPLDVTPFRYSREIAAGSSGLVALPLDPAVLAHSAGPDGEFADVRIVDGSGRQVPRLVERRPEPLVVSLRAEPATAVAAELLPKDGLHRSIYRITLPYPALRDARLVIGTPAPMFQRHVTLGYERPADRGHRDPWFLQVASVEWSRTPESPAVLTLGLPAPVADATDLTLVVDEGDNSALPIGTVQMLLPSYRLRFVRPASATRLVYGASPMERPRYDLALLAPTVLAASVADVSMSPEVESASPAVKPLISPRMFWLVLVVAVAVLLGLLVLLLRRTD